jgi:hypothetical protein
MSKHKVGDHVRVSAYPEESTERTYYWFPEMDKFKGTVFAVKANKRVEGDQIYTLEPVGPTDGRGEAEELSNYGFMEDWLEPVPKFMVGDLVRVTDDVSVIVESLQHITSTEAFDVEKCAGKAIDIVSLRRNQEDTGWVYGVNVQGRLSVGWAQECLLPFVPRQPKFKLGDSVRVLTSDNLGSGKVFTVDDIVVRSTKYEVWIYKLKGLSGYVFKECDLAR